MTATALKLEKSFAPSAKPDAEIVVLFPGKKETNEEIRQRQYAAQMAMMAENKAKGILITAESYVPHVTPGVQHQPVRAVSQTAAEQASLQGAKGFAFKL